MDDSGGQHADSLSGPEDDTARESKTLNGQSSSFTFPETSNGSNTNPLVESFEPSSTDKNLRRRNTSEGDPSYQHKKLKLEVQESEVYLQNFTNSERKNYVKVLVLYTGGTIGMCTKGGVYVPKPNYLVPTLRKTSILHDDSFELDSHAQSPGVKPETLPLVLPNSKECIHRIVYTVCEYEPLLDSANMTFEDYARLATDIQVNYDKFDAFVILHGTDTMAYTASALSFMLENLGKTVVLTGSQIPIFETRSDGRDNFLGALMLAGNFNIPEVSLYFNNKLLRGNRATKEDAEGLNAFKSHNLPPLAQLSITIKVQWAMIWRERSMERMTAHTVMCPDVGILRLFPSITSATVRAFLQPPMRGMVLQSYGAGNGPDARKDLMAIFREATQRGMMIVNITQCSRGQVCTAYATGKALLDCGVIPGSDLTAEAALMKLSYILSKEEWSDDKKREMMNVNMRGEMQVAKKERPYQFQINMIDKIAEMLRISSVEEIERLQETMYPTLTCAATKLGNIEAVKNLKHAGASMCLGDYSGRTPLHIAAVNGDMPMVKYLLSYGASVHMCDMYGKSPLDDAVRFNKHDVIRLLVKTGAHLKLPAHRLGMVLCNMAQFDSLEGLESWRLAGADLNQADATGRTALHVAVARGEVPMVEYLSKHGCVSNFPDVFGNTVWDEAKKLAHTHILQILQGYIS